MGVAGWQAHPAALCASVPPGTPALQLQDRQMNVPAPTASREAKEQGGSACFMGDFRNTASLPEPDGTG